MIRVISQPMLAVILALAYINSRQLRALSVAAWLTIVVIFWRSNYALISNEPIVDFVALCAASAIILLVLNQFHTRMHQSLAKVREANAALHGHRANLEAQVAERTAVLQQAMENLEARAAEQQRLLAETEQQRDAIRALSLPILPINQTTLAAPLIGTFNSQRLADLQQHMLLAIERSGAKTLVLDITGVPAVDHEVALGILRVAQATRLMGARVVLAGIRPEVAQALVSLGVDLSGLLRRQPFRMASRWRRNRRLATANTFRLENDDAYIASRRLPAARSVMPMLLRCIGVRRIVGRGIHNRHIPSHPSALELPPRLARFRLMRCDQLLSRPLIARQQKAQRIGQAARPGGLAVGRLGFFLIL